MVLSEKDKTRMTRGEHQTSFGFKEVPLAEKQGLVDDVFASVARRYDLMNDLMSAGLHRAWKDALVTTVNPPKGNHPFALLDVAGGTGDIAFRVVDAGGAGTHATVMDINGEMLKAGRARADSKGYGDRVIFVEGNAEALPFPDRSFDAVTIAFGIRNVPRIQQALNEAHRVLKIGGRFACLEFSSVDVPGLDKLYDHVFLQRDPGDGARGDRRRRGLSLSRGIHPEVSEAEGFRADDRDRRLPPRRLQDHDRRRCRAAFRLAIVISSISHLARLARAGFVFAREGVFALVDPVMLPLPARFGLRMARLIERPKTASSEGRLAAALTELGPTYVKLGQFLATRPDVVGAKLARELESLQDRMPPFAQSEAEATVAAAFDKPLSVVFTSFGPPVAAASIAQVHRAEVMTAKRTARGGGESAAPSHRTAFQGRSRRFLFRRAQGRSDVGRRPPPAADRGGGYPGAFGAPRDGPAAGSRRAVGTG